MVEIKLGIIGADGRMGTALREHITDVPDITITATLEAGEDLAGFIAAKPDVVVDLSIGTAVAVHGVAIVAAGLPYIIGATAVSEATIAALQAACVESKFPVLLVPNFSIGANLMMKCADQAAALMASPVITERHHEKKLDAPSGTARLTAERIAAAGGAYADVPIHSVRGAGYLAEQQVQFSLPGETLTIEHRSIDRRCFMPGIIFAIRNIRRVEGLTVGLDTLLDI